MLIDKDETSQRFTVAPDKAPLGPTAEEFEQHLDDFLYHVVWTAKKIRRGELWVATSCFDGYMKRLLLRIIEWHARALHGWDYDTWFNGRFLERWADQAVIAELKGIFTHYDSSDIRSSLLQIMKMHNHLYTQTARKLGCQTWE